MFPEPIMDCVYSLRDQYRAKKSCVIANYPIIEIVKYMKDREISVKLFYFSTNSAFEMQPPDETFHSKISHLDYRVSERRWVRNKDFLFQVIKDFKRCGLWDYVSNKDLVVVNASNSRVNALELLETLREMVG